MHPLLVPPENGPPTPEQILFVYRILTANLEQRIAALSIKEDTCVNDVIQRLAYQGNAESITTLSEVFSLFSFLSAISWAFDIPLPAQNECSVLVPKEVWKMIQDVYELMGNE